MSVVTNQPIQVAYFIADIATAIVTYDRIRWYRSRTGSDGLFEAATAASVAAASITGTALTPHAVNGKTLSFKVNGVTQVDVDFTDPDPVTTTQVIAAITSATSLVVASDASGAVKLTTVATGSGASIEILSSDAAAYLGFTAGDGVVGLDADTTLVSGTHEYFYTDQNSDESFWYEAELFNSSTADTAGLSVPFPADQIQSVPKSATIVGFVRLVDMAGKPISGRTVAFYNSAMPNTVTVSSTDYSVARQYMTVDTDSEGYAEFRLLRGIQVDVNIVGTGFTRRIQIPSTGDSFNLFDSSLVVTDEFGIQEPDIDFAVRTS